GRKELSTAPNQIQMKILGLFFLKTWLIQASRRLQVINHFFFQDQEDIENESAIEKNGEIASLKKTHEQDMAKIKEQGKTVSLMPEKEVFNVAENLYEEEFSLGLTYYVLLPHARSLIAHLF
ncbi:hypothetical protein ACJX0J_019684, partial [Zea mays]